MDEVTQMFARHRKAYETNYHDFSRIFGVSLAGYWDKMFGFDVVAFNEKFIKSGDNESMAEAVKRQYGAEAVALIKNLL